MSVGIGVLVLATFVWAFVFVRPGRRRAALATVGLEPPARDSWLRAVVLSALALAVVLALAMLRPQGDLGLLGRPTLTVLAIAAIADVISDWRARKRATLVAVWALHDPLLAEAARVRLGAIPCHVQSQRVRTLVGLFGAYVPMIVLVPEASAEEAHGLLKTWFESTTPAA